MDSVIVRAGAEVGLDVPYRDLRFLSGWLFAETLDRRRLHATGGTIGVVFAGGRSQDPAKRATRHDIDQSIRRMVGAEAGLTPVSHLAWEQLDGVLEREGVATNENELIAVPFVVEYSEELLAELEH